MTICPSPAGNPTTASQEKGDSADVGNVIKPHSAPAGDARTPAPEPSQAAMEFAMQEYGATSLDDCFDYEISRLKRRARIFDDFAARAVEAAVAKERARLGFGEIVMMSEQRNKPGLAPHWCALARGRGRAAMGDTEDEARINALAIESGREAP